MFGIAWDNREEGRNVRQSHLNSLPLFPPRLIDRGVSGDTILTYPSSAGQASHQGRNPRRPRSAGPRTRSPQFAPTGSRREEVCEPSEVSPEAAEDEEEQFRPR